MKKRLLWIGIAFSIAVLVAGCYLVYQHIYGQPTVSNPDRFIRPDKNGNCTNGYVNYGVPLGCITKEQYHNCQTAKYGCPICLAASTLIVTSKGLVPVTNLVPGDMVWSMNKGQQRILVPIKRVGHMKSPQGFMIKSITLADGRTLKASASHPTTGGRQIGELRVGDRLNGAKIISIKSIDYSNQYTYDLLPDSDTGYYWADGVLLGSTLKQ